MRWMKSTPTVRLLATDGRRYADELLLAARLLWVDVLEARQHWRGLHLPCMHSSRDVRPDRRHDGRHSNNLNKGRPDKGKTADDRHG